MEDILPGGGFHPDVVRTLIQLGPFCSLFCGWSVNGLSTDPGMMKSDGVQSTLSGLVFFFSKWIIQSDCQFTVQPKQNSSWTIEYLWYLATELEKRSMKKMCKIWSDKCDIVILTPTMAIDKKKCKFKLLEIVMELPGISPWVTTLRNDKELQSSPLYASEGSNDFNKSLTWRKLILASLIVYGSSTTYDNGRLKALKTNRDISLKLPL